MPSGDWAATFSEDVRAKKKKRVVLFPRWGKLGEQGVRRVEAVSEKNVGQ